MIFEAALPDLPQERVADRVRQAVQLALLDARDHELRGDQQQEDGDGENDEVRHWATAEGPGARRPQAGRPGGASTEHQRVAEAGRALPALGEGGSAGLRVLVAPV